MFCTLEQYSSGSIVRHFYGAGAMSLEGNDVFTLSSVQTAEWVMNDYARAVNHLRTRLNPKLAKGLEGVLVFEIEGTRRGLHIRNCVAEYLPEVDKLYRAPDAGIAVDGESFTRYFRGEATGARLLEKARVSGNAAALLAAFDTVKPLPMYPKA